MGDEFLEGWPLLREAPARLLRTAHGKSEVRVMDNIFWRRAFQLSTRTPAHTTQKVLTGTSFFDTCLIATVSPESCVKSTPRVWRMKTLPRWGGGATPQTSSINKPPQPTLLTPRKTFEKAPLPSSCQYGAGRWGLRVPCVEMFDKPETHTPYLVEREGGLDRLENWLRYQLGSCDIGVIDVGGGHHHRVRVPVF